MKDRATLEFELTGLWTIHLRAGQVAGQQVRGKLQAVEITLYTPGKFLDGGGLGKPRCALHQQVTVRQ